MCRSVQGQLPSVRWIRGFVKITPHMRVECSLNGHIFHLEGRSTALVCLSVLLLSVLWSRTMSMEV